MNAEMMSKPLYAKAHRFVKVFNGILRGMGSEDYDMLKDDVNIAMFRMRDAIATAYGEEDKLMAVAAFGYARGKTGALSAYVEILSQQDGIKPGDAVELGSMLEEINSELTVIMKQLDPRVDKWRDEYFEEFGEAPEDLDQIRGEDEQPPPDDR